MNQLHRKLLRDLIHMRGQVIAIALVVACGVAMVVTTRASYESLSISKSTYYAEYRFADIFAGLERAPERMAAHIRSVPGVQDVRTRIVLPVTLDIPGLEEPATGRLVSIPERRISVLNGVHIKEGRYVEPGRRNEVLVSDAFAEANDFRPGDTLDAVLNGRWERLHIVGIGLSPEYVYEIRESDVLPDSRRFGVLWMSREAMGPAFDMEGAFNDVVVSLSADAVEEDVIAEIDRLLDRYGGLGAYGSEDQVSNRFVSDEIASTRVIGMILPTVFLGVAAFLLNIVLSRLVSTQRDQIAILKAFGYRSATVAVHYLEFALFVVVLGSLIGTPVGVWLGSVINSMYVQFYRFPVLRYEVGPSIVLLGIGVSAVAAALGALGAVRRALLLPPAEAMRPEPPPPYHAGTIERLGLRRYFSFSARMILRDIARRPVRALLTITGIALAVAILVISRFFVDALAHMADVQFRFVQRDDMIVSYLDPEPARAAFEMSRLAGVLMAEPFRAVPARLRHEHRSRRVGILGLPWNVELRGLVDEKLKSVELPREGIVLTERLAEILGAKPGDSLTVEVLEGARPKREVRIASVVNELIGLSSYMEITALNRMMREGGTVSGALLSVDPLASNRLYGRLKRTPAVSGVALREAMLESFEKTIAQNMGATTRVVVTFACVIAFAVVYNAARISLSERGRELASLRVLGFTRGEVSTMLLGEQALLTALSIPAGFCIGYWLSAAISHAYQWELFRIPLVVSNRTYAFAFLVIVSAAILSALAVRRKIYQLDLVAVLKTRE